MESDNRQSTRKVLKTKAQLSIEESRPVEVRTIDISVDGLGLLLPGPVTPGQPGKIVVNMYFDGKAHIVSAVGKITYCVFSGGEFRAGFKFVRLEPAAPGAISAYLK